jgi:hypothetical protein
VEHGEAALREAYALFEQRGNNVNLAETAMDLADASVRKGSLDEAEHFCNVVARLSATDDVANESRRSALRARIRAARGDLAGAKEEAERAVELTTGIDYPEWTADAWLMLATVRRAGGDTEDQAAALEALRLYEQKGNLVGAGWVRAFLAEGDAPQ